MIRQGLGFRELRGLRGAMEILPLPQGLILTYDEEESLQAPPDRRIAVMPVWKWRWGQRKIRELFPSIKKKLDSLDPENPVKVEGKWKTLISEADRGYGGASIHSEAFQRIGCRQFV